MNDELHAVLEAFGLAGATAMELGDSDNLNHRVTTLSGESFLLRQHRSARHNRVALESELIWLNDLHAQGLEVQRPVALSAGGFILELESGLYSGSYSVLTWIEGDVFERLDAPQAELTGALMARLHLAAQDFVPPANFTRPLYDTDHFERILEQFSSLEWLAPDLDLLSKATGFAQSGFQDTNDVCLVHGDLHTANLVFNTGRVTAIDFDRCGFAPMGFDIATALGFLEPVLSADFLRGYETVSPLPSGFNAYREAYNLASYLENLAFLAFRPAERTFVETEMLPALRAEFPALLETEK
jgi:Ser/Thr protein kinase RdoA (MazF antagonist)